MHVLLLVNKYLFYIEAYFKHTMEEYVDHV